MVTLTSLAEQVTAQVPDLLPAQAPVQVFLDAEVHGITSNSREVQPGMLFAALPGDRVHGASFVTAALEAGAVAVVTDEQGHAMMQNADVPVLTVPNIKTHIGLIASIVYGDPGERLRLFAITGTNGKTTTSYMLEHILRSADCKVGMIGGVELKIGTQVAPSVLTTPMPSDLQRLLAQHVDAGGTDLVMEVTSHALVQHRVDPLRFDVAGFTNLTQDHLDYHDSLEDYFLAKASLFTPQRCEAAVILVDDEWGRRLFELASARVPRVFALGLHSQLPPGAQGWSAQLGHEQRSFVLRSTGGEDTQHEVSLPGEFNISNAALAVCMALVAGVPRARIPKLIAPIVPGRMELISESHPRVVVDFAHNTAALQQAMQALRPGLEGELIVVTGSAGDRDADKRADMGRAVAEAADLVYITDDDPHSEPPELIRRALLDGTLGGPAVVTEIADRSEAIHAAILRADDNDTVLIAGRGHETVQEVGAEQRELDDRVVARAALQRRHATE